MCTINPTPYIQNPKPETLNPKPETQEPHRIMLDMLVEIDTDVGICERILSSPVNPKILPRPYLHP